VAWGTELARRCWRRLCDLSPFTARGYLVAAGAGAGLWVLGLGTLDLVVFVMALAAMVLLGASVLAVAVAALYLRRALPQSSKSFVILEAGSPLRTGFTAPGLQRWPLVQLTWTWSDPPTVTARTVLLDGHLVEEVVARERCQVTTVERRFAVRDAFGLAEIAWQARTPCTMTIFPSIGCLRDLPAVRAQGGGDDHSHPAGAPEGDRLDIRRYTPGDPVRDIAWQLYARSGKLIVRNRERAFDRATRTAAYLVTGPADEAAAAAARVAIESGALGRGWLFGGDGIDDVSGDSERALRSIAGSGSQWGTRLSGEGTGLGGFLTRAHGAGRTHCVVFAPARHGPWIQQVLHAVRRHPGGISVVVAADGIAQPTAPRPLWQRLLFPAVAPDGMPVAEVALVTRQLSGAAAVTLVDRKTGRSYDQRVLAGTPASAALARGSGA
jgi:Protein of unknown function DUF58